MGFLDWLFGKKETTATPTAPQGAARAPTPAQPNSEANNLRRWQESGRPRAWVEAHNGQWNHEDWLALLEELRRTPFWPMHPDKVGAVLEDVKREWLRRN